MNNYQFVLQQTITELQKDIDKYRQGYESTDSYPEKSGHGEALATIIECQLKAVQYCIDEGKYE